MALVSGAIWRGPIPNRTPGAMQHPARGLVLHVEEGTEAGTDSWFHNPKAQASADFGIAKDGTLHQWVDCLPGGPSDKAWAEAYYNPHWYSVETEGTHSEPLTDAQCVTVGRLFRELSHADGFPLQVTDDPQGQGLITHGALGNLGGGHFGCPGDARSAQRQHIADLARGAPAPPAPPPPAPVQEWRKVVYVRAFTPEAVFVNQYPFIFGPGSSTVTVTLAPLEPFPEPIHYGAGSFSLGFTSPAKSYAGVDRYATLVAALHGEGV